MYRKDTPNSIQSMFNSIAKRYDFTNAVLSLSLHKRWKRTLIKTIRKDLHSRVLVDLCSGTGDIAIDYLKSSPHPCQAYLIDFSSEMLKYAKHKAEKLNLPDSHRLAYIEADVQQLPLSDQIADCATMAYGIRNVKDPAKCIQEVYRTLKPGGRFGILELTRPDSKFLRFGHQLYLKAFLPFVGKLITDNKEAYQYLCQSIQAFIPPQEIENMLLKSGFKHTHRISLGGGIATVIIGHKDEQ